MITLASDFGSPYPAAMRGVVLARCDARLVDVAHDLPRQDVRAAAFWLREVLPYFPPAVHLAVVDPGVGTDRAALVVRAGDHLLVGPDNGLLLPAARRIVRRERGAAEGNGDDDPDGPNRGSDGAGRDPDGMDSEPDDEEGGTDGDESGTASPAERSPLELYEWRHDNPESSTFHGRDVFAPAAAAVHEAGVDGVADLPAVAPAEEVVDLHLPEPTVADDGATGEVLVVDGFGNVVTNVPGAVLDDRERVTVGGERVPVERSYAAVGSGERVVTVGSHGNVELAVNRGRGDEAFGLTAGDRFHIGLR